MLGKTLKSRLFAAVANIWRLRRLIGILVAAGAVVLGGIVAATYGTSAGILAAVGLLSIGAAGMATAGITQKLRSLLAEFASIIESQRSELRALAARLIDMRFMLEERANVASVGIARAEEAQARLTARLAGHAERLDAFSANSRLAAEKSRRATKAEAERLTEVDTRVRDLTGRVQGYHVHERTLSKTDLAALETEWAAALGLRRSKTSLGYLAARIRAVEALCVGRLATSSQTMIARILAAQAIGGRDLRILEIGVLFGVAAACFYDACAERYDSVRLTLIDPLEGYYDEDKEDVITGVAVTRSALERNLRAAGVPQRNYSIVQSLSSEPSVQAALASEEFDLLLIDGDHSFEGVKRDYQIFAPLVRPGGFILFDDYGVNEWPEIKRFVDEDPAKNPALQLVAAGFRTAAFRVLERLPRPA